MIEPSKEQKLEYIEAICINTIYSLLEKAAKETPPELGLAQGDAIRTTSLALLAARSCRTNSSEEALVALATALATHKIKEQHNG